MVMWWAGWPQVHCQRSRLYPCEKGLAPRTGVWCPQPQTRGAVGLPHVPVSPTDGNLNRLGSIFPETYRAGSKSARHMVKTQ